jgi:NAD(P)-dependent dehydrogenase (short-subunit alcohol dehydrogenase family)
MVQLDVTDPGSITRAGSSIETEFGRLDPLVTVSPGYTSTASDECAGTESVEDGAREVVRVAQLDSNGPSGTFTRQHLSDDACPA